MRRHGFSASTASLLLCLAACSGGKNSTVKTTTKDSSNIASGSEKMGGAENSHVAASNQPVDSSNNGELSKAKQPTEIAGIPLDGYLSCEPDNSIKPAGKSVGCNFIDKKSLVKLENPPDVSTLEAKVILKNGDEIHPSIVADSLSGYQFVFTVEANERAQISAIVVYYKDEKKAWGYQAEHLTTIEKQAAKEFTNAQPATLHQLKASETPRTSDEVQNPAPTSVPVVKSGEPIPQEVAVTSNRISKSGYVNAVTEFDFCIQSGSSPSEGWRENCVRLTADNGIQYALPRQGAVSTYFKSTLALKSQEGAKPITLVRICLTNSLFKESDAKNNIANYNNESAQVMNGAPFPAGFFTFTSQDNPPPRTWPHRNTCVEIFPGANSIFEGWYYDGIGVAKLPVGAAIGRDTPSGINSVGIVAQAFSDPNQQPLGDIKPQLSLDLVLRSDIASPRDPMLWARANSTPVVIDASLAGTPEFQVLGLGFAANGAIKK